MHIYQFIYQCILPDHFFDRNFIKRRIVYVNTFQLINLKNYYKSQQKQMAIGNNENTYASDSTIQNVDIQDDSFSQKECEPVELNSL